MINFTNCEKVLDRAYNGANGNKIAIRYNDEIYMLKFPARNRGINKSLSYSNGCVSEYIACNIFNMLGIKAQETTLGFYEVKNINKIVCACKDFTTGGKRLFDFCSIKNTILDSESSGAGTELEDILDTINKQEYVNPKDLLEHFWNMFVVDAFLANFDRHNGNWGFLYNNESNAFEIAPIFDCGSCLLPQADEKIIDKIMNDINELNSRIFVFPNSIIKINDNKINYFNLLTTTTNQDCKDAVKRIVPRIDLDRINELIDEIDDIPTKEKRFYRYYIKARYDMILKPALDFANI